MKIALNIEHFTPSKGGAERYVYDLAREMGAMGYEVHVFSTDGIDIPNSNIVLHIVPIIKWPKILSTLSFIINSAIQIKKVGFDIVHVFGKNIYMNVFQPLGGSHKASFIQNLHSVGNPFYRAIKFFTSLISLKKLLFFYLEKVQLRAKKDLRMIAISKMVRDAFIKYYNFPAENMDVVYNGIDLQRFHPRNKDIYREKVRTSLGIPMDKKVLVFIANNFRLKGLESAIRVLANVRRRTASREFVLLVVGRGRQRWFKKIAKKLGCLEDIIFVGYKDKVEEYIACADICFQPSFYDPGSLVVLEALASGVPVVTTRFNGMSEIITDGQEGFVVDEPRDIEELTDKIIFFKDELNLKRCSINARHLAERFPFSKNCEEVLAVYKKVLKI